MPRTRRSEPEFIAGPYVGQSTVEGLAVVNNLIDMTRLLGPIRGAIEHGPTAVSRAITAVEGLAQVLAERSQHRATIMDESSEVWESGAAQALRLAMYRLIGSTPEHPQVVRNDVTDESEKHGTTIVKGQGSPSTPLYLLERSTAYGKRSLDVLDGRPEHMAEVMTEVNAFSLPEHVVVAAYIGERTINSSLRDRVLEHANRYTTPDTDALWGALQFEAHGPAGLTAWPEQMATYALRKGHIPS